ncbi:hypothetical protein LIER_31945 [Lithospermum erythrorhizon]|uniref:Uncharacterized protein n=1 Tax=Lithospermum erythrorhizon TaxID=34254 RepID=A0AAV3RTH6_LITER
MSSQDSSVAPIMDQFDDVDIVNDEAVGGIEIGELNDLNTSQNDVSTAVDQSTEALDDTDPQSTYGKGGRAKKSIVHIEMEIITLPNGTKKWKCKWCGSLYQFDEKYKSISNGKKYLDNYLQRKLKLRNSGKEPSQSRLSVGDANPPSIAT